jgi:hypothetical protein
MSNLLSFRDNNKWRLLGAGCSKTAQRLHRLRRRPVQGPWSGADLRVRAGQSQLERRVEAGGIDGGLVGCVAERIVGADFTLETQAVTVA